MAIEEKEHLVEKSHAILRSDGAVYRIPASKAADLEFGRAAAIRLQRPNAKIV